MFIKNLIHFKYNRQYVYQSYSVVGIMFIRNFIHPFWAFFKKFITRKAGIMSINLTKSYFHHTLNDLYESIRFNKLRAPFYSKSHKSVLYKQPNVLLSFSFQKQVYNTFMFYILFTLVSNYSSTKNDFKLYYGYIIRPQNFLQYSFLNLFYFRLKHF
jgi:hypothetical protein